MSLINSIVSKQEQVSDITILNPYNVKNFKNDKLSILNIKARCHSGRLFSIEMQISDEADYNKEYYIIGLKYILTSLGRVIDMISCQKLLAYIF